MRDKAVAAVPADCGHGVELADLRAEVARLNDELRQDYKLAHAVDGSPRACMVADAEDGFRLMYLNPASEAVFDRLAQWLRVAHGEVTGSRIDEVLGLEEFSPRVVGSLRAPISGIYKVGEEWLDFYVAPVTDPGGRLVALFMAGTIVTARQQMAQAIASESEQMMAAISEIARNAQKAAATANEAARTAEAANETVTKLGQSSAEVGGVVDLISRIASQTRLLALNATIEAARVGEAGRGFAVVASEVKQLAQETAQATDEIGARIQAIQAQSRDAVSAINMILGIVKQIDQTQAAIASAVEEQTATSAELSRLLAANVA